MPIERPPIPALPECHRSRPIANKLCRSYPVGAQEFSRAFSQRVLELTISTEDSFPENVQAVLVTTLNAKRPDDWIEIPFVRSDEKEFTCRVTPDRPGLYSFRARFSDDGGETWLQDPVPDAWVLVDPPQVDDLRLYTMIPTVSGTISDWIKDLSRIKEMGFNAVHLLPITSMDTSHSPYAARDLFAIDDSYLAADDPRDGLSQLEAYIEEAKKLDIRLCFDLVFNHIGAQSSMARRAPDWIVPDEYSPDGFRRARYWSDRGWLTWEDLVVINYEHPSEVIRTQIWAYMTEYALFWSKYAHETNGFVRFDNLHSSDSGFLPSLTKAMRTQYPDLGIIAEYFTDDDTLLNTVPLWRLNLILATPWDSKFVPQLREYLKYLHRHSEHIRYFMPITSHDSGTPAQEFGASEATIPRYVVVALLGTGATGITQGVEWGEPNKIEFIGRHPKRTPPTEPEFAGFFRIVNEILACYPSFRCGANCEFVDNGHQAVIAAFRRDKGAHASGFLVVCNFDIQNQQYIETDLSHVLGTEGPLTCRDLLSGEEMSFPSARLNLILEPCAAHVLMFS